jgi:hypothetical protein
MKHLKELLIKSTGLILFTSWIWGLDLMCSTLHAICTFFGALLLCVHIEK